MFSKAVMLLALVYTSKITQAEDLPEYLHVCKKSNSQLENCMRKSIETLKPYLVTGIPEIDIPKIEPIHIGDLLLSNSDSDQGVKIIAKDVKAYGCSNFDVGKLEVVDYSKKYNIRLHLPQLYVKGKYIVDGRILVLPIKGSGKFNGNFTNCIGDVKITAEKIQDGDKNHMTVKHLDIKVKVGKGHLHLDNLFNGNKELGDLINETINSNFNLYSKEIIPLVEKALADYFYKIGNKIVSKYSEEQLFPL